MSQPRKEPAAMPSAKRMAPLFLAALFLLASFSFAGLRWMPARLPADALGAPIITPTTTMVLTSGGRLAIYDSRNGLPLPSYNLSSSAHLPPLVGESAMFIATDDGRVEALDPSRMRRLWIYPPAAGAGGAAAGGAGESTTGAEASNNTSLALDIRSMAEGGGLLYVIDRTRVLALDAQTGRPRFERQLLDDGGQAAADAEKAYVMDGGTLKAISANGQLVWSRQVGALFKTRPAADGGRVYVASTDGQIEAIDSSSGGLNWTYSVNGWPMATPLADGQRVMVGTNDGRLRALDAFNGHILWTADLHAAVWGEMALATHGGERLVLAPTQAPSLAAVDAESGALRWQYPLSDWPASPASDSSGTYAAIATRDGQLWMLALSPMCTIDSPLSRQLIGPYPRVMGRAWAWGGVQRASLDIAGSHTDLPLGSDGTFAYEPDLSGNKEGAVAIQCLAEAKDGQLESDAGMPKSNPALSVAVQQAVMSVTAVSQARPGQMLRVFVRNADGMDLNNLEVDFGGRHLSGASSPFEIAAPDAEGSYTLKAGRRGFGPASAQVSVESDKSWILLAGALAVAVIAFVAYVAFVRRKPVREPSIPAREQVGRKEES